MSGDQPDQPERDAADWRNPAQQDKQTVHRSQYQRLFDSPDLLAWQVDIQAHRLLLARMQEAGYRQAVFLDQRLNLDGKIDAFWVPFEKIAADFPSQLAQVRDACFLFHIGHCGSTLLSRLLGHHAQLLPLREPLSLRNLASAQRLLDESQVPLSTAQWRDQLHILLCLLARSYAVEQRALIKASSSCNRLLPEVLGSNERHRAILLYTGFTSYLASVLRPQSRGALNNFAQERISDLRRIVGKHSPALLTPSPARLGAMNWCTSMAQFIAASNSKAIRHQITLINFDDLLRTKTETLNALFRFLGIEIDSLGIDRIISGTDYLTTYAKDSTVYYTPELRADDLRHSSQVHGREIAEARSWLETLVHEAPQLAPLLTLVDQERGP